MVATGVDRSRRALSQQTDDDCNCAIAFTSSDICRQTVILRIPTASYNCALQHAWRRYRRRGSIIACSSLALNSAVSPDVVSCQRMITCNDRSRARCRFAASMPVSDGRLCLYLCLPISFRYCYSSLTHGNVLLNCPFLTLSLILPAIPLASYLHHCVGVSIYCS